ncbi:uncharacterized protein LOC118933793 [Manis pentadactyla]|uniref:uncharacterized protein LOC118933793 n=1 Tax=Manis pentadactyla TaxID=143292 RepID=UPI00255CF03A|nr:uncharacterized protein LOC118933793 [Manis pentadactyla]
MSGLPCRPRTTPSSARTPISETSKNHTTNVTLSPGVQWWVYGGDRGSLRPPLQSFRSPRRPRGLGSPGYPRLLARIYLKAELRLTCAGRAEGRSKRGRGLLSVRTPALAGKWSGTAAFLSICTVTRAVWKEVGRRCACCTWISVHKCVRVPVRLCTENFLGIDGIFLAAICAACIRINPGRRQTAPGSPVRSLFGPARDAKWLLGVRAAASPAFSQGWTLSALRPSGPSLPRSAWQSPPLAVLREPPG